MGMATLVRFLVGQRQAIVAVSSCPQALWVGALFVLSAGFAREYDQEDLLHAPWYLVLPLVASLATSFVLFGLLDLAANSRTIDRMPFLPTYRRFLSLYWMTAPLAWLYAMPVETFLDAADSVRANLTLLALVSLWRVLLITRCASILFGASYRAVFFLVMLFADTLALVILYLTPLPVFNIMGGIPLTESEAVMRRVACEVQGYGGLSWLVWFIGSLVVMGSSNRNWAPLRLAGDAAACVTKPLWTLAFAALAVWAFVLPYSQPQQQLRRIVEADLLQGQIAPALERMSAHDRGDFPPHWDPPPWHGYGEDRPPLIKVLQAIEEGEAAEWVRNVFLEKFLRQLNREMAVYYLWDQLDDNEFTDYVEAIRRYPETHDIVRRQRTMFLDIMHRQLEDQRTRQDQMGDLLRELGILQGASDTDSQESAVPSNTNGDR